jgi:hypothetical protein
VSLRVVGAGLGRTGTASLKQALELLLDGRCYHMFEVSENGGHDLLWRSAVGGEAADWSALLEGFTATVDWPACAFWSELASANPGAVVLLSTRESAQQWWASMERTIVPTLQRAVPPGHPDLARHRAMVRELLSRRFTQDWQDGEAAMAAYERHNEEVRRSADPARLVEWRPGDGWGPLCDALGVAVPQAEFPHENTRADFRARIGLDDVA